MGKPRDMAQRITLARVDDASRRHRVATARNIIYEKQYAVHSTAVENLLQADSLVPTAVRIIFFLVDSDDHCLYSHSYCRMHFRSNYQNLGFLYFPC